MASYQKIFNQKWIDSEFRDGYPGKAMLALRLVNKETGALNNPQVRNYLASCSRRSYCPFYRLLLFESLGLGKNDLNDARKEVVKIVETSGMVSVRRIAEKAAREQIMDKAEAPPALEEKHPEKLIQLIIDTKREIQKFGRSLLMRNLSKQELYMHAEASKN